MEREKEKREFVLSLLWLLHLPSLAPSFSRTVKMQRLQSTHNTYYYLGRKRFLLVVYEVCLLIANIFVVAAALPSGGKRERERR